MQQHLKTHGMIPPTSHNDHETHPSFQSQVHDPPSFPHTQFRPYFPSTIHQNSSNSSSSTQPIMHQPSRFQSSNKRASCEPIMHQPSSSSKETSSEPNMDDECNEYDEYEMKLLNEVEIIDEEGNILRTQEMETKDVWKLKDTEKILVHVNPLDQPIKAAGGLCTRFMTLLLKQPNLCPPVAKDWREIKKSCGVRLIGELRRRFSLPQTENVDKVLFANFDDKYRARKYRSKLGLYKLVASRLREVDNIGNDGAQERQYTEEEILQALELVDTPSNFLDHQWELYKSHLRSPTTKKMSQDGKKARRDQVHNHTTGACSFARKKDEFKVKNKREAKNVEFFEISHLTKGGVYVQDTSREFVEQARQEISKKILELDTSESIDLDQHSNIERDVMEELMGPNKPGRARGHGAGLTKSQITNLSYDLRRMRGKCSTNQNQVPKLVAQVESQNRKIESQNKQIEYQKVQIKSQKMQIESQNKEIKEMHQTVDDIRGDFRVFQMALKDMYSARTSCEEVSATQLSSGASREDYH